MTVEDLKGLIDHLQTTHAATLDLESGDLKVKIAWNHNGTPSIPAPNGLTLVRAPIDGVFCGEGVDKKSLVREGETVEVGRVLCVIDSRGQLNEIESEVAGQVAAIHVKPGDVVKVNQPLFEIKS